MLLTMQEKVNQTCIANLQKVNVLIKQGRKSEAERLKTDIVVTLNRNKIH